MTAYNFSKSTIVRTLEAKKRKELIKMIDKLIENRKKELAIFERNITEQIKRVIQIAQDTKKSKYPVEYMVEVNKKTSDYIKKFLQAGRVNV